MNNTTLGSVADSFDHTLESFVHVKSLFQEVFRCQLSSVCLEGFGGRPDRCLVTGMTSWGRSRAAANKVITDDLAPLVRLQVFSRSNFLVSMQKL